ncbi:MAG: serine hydrolase domain-containing protein [Bacteroidota bacterium]
MTRIKSTVLLTLLTICTALHAQKINTVKLDSIVASKIAGLSPGLAVGIVHNGAVIYTKYAGYANLEHKIPVNEESRFNIASNAKQFTALCVLTLALEGKLSLEDDLRKFLPEFYPKVPSKIKIKHLINHSSGIRDYSNLMSMQGRPWWSRVGLDNKDALDLLKKQDRLNFEPGSRHSYSNSNYTLLTAVVEKASGTSFVAYADEVLKSLGMEASTFTENYMAVIPNKTLPYSDWGDGVWQQYPSVVSLHGDGFLFTTLNDQLAWEQLIQTVDEENDLYELIKASQLKVSNAVVDSYGYGLELSKTYKGYQILEHAGGTGSYSAQFIRIPKENISVVVMSNNGSVWSLGLTQEMLDEVLNLQSITNEPFAARPKVLATRPKVSDLIGSYILEGSTVIEITETDGNLYRHIEGRDPVQLIPVEGNLYQYESSAALKLAFVKNEDGAYNFVLYHPEIVTRLAVRLSDAPLTMDYFEAFNGTYSSTELNVQLHLKYTGDNTFSIVRNEDETDRFDATLLAKDFLQSGNFNAKPTYDSYGRVKSLLLEDYRNKNIEFARMDMASFSNSQPTSDGGRITVGTTTESYGKGKGDVFLSKTNAAGNEEWVRTYGGKGYERGSSVTLTPDGGYLAVGSTSSFGKGNYDMYVIKTNAKGKLLWQQSFGAFYNDYGYTVEVIENGYLIKGVKQECSSNELDRDCREYVWFLEIDLEGKEVDQRLVEEINPSIQDW